MARKIGFDATSITKKHDGGKNQFALNLLRGFEKIGVAEQLVVFCMFDMQEEILRVTPNAVLVPVTSNKEPHQGMKSYWLRTFVLPGYLRRHHIGVFLFPSFATGLRRYPVSTVVVPHDIQSQTNQKRFKIITRLLDGFCYYYDFKLRDRIVAISDFDKHEIVTTYPSHRDKVIRIYNPIYTDLFTSAGTYQAGKPYIVAVNIQFKHKNTVTLIKAFEKIKEIIPHDLYLIGHTIAETEYLVHYVHEHGLSHRIAFKGFLRDAELAEILKGSALYVNPSFFEGFGMTAVEAMLTGVPVLASNVAAVPEVTMGLCRYYSPPDDVTRLAEMMNKMLHEPDRSDTRQLKMIVDKLEERYHYVKIAHQYYDLLMSLLSDGRSG